MFCLSIYARSSGECHPTSVCLCVHTSLYNVDSNRFSSAGLVFSFYFCHNFLFGGCSVICRYAQYCHHSDARCERRFFWCATNIRQILWISPAGNCLSACTQFGENFYLHGNKIYPTRDGNGANETNWILNDIDFLASVWKLYKTSIQSHTHEEYCIILWNYSNHTTINSMYTIFEISIIFVCLAGLLFNVHMHNVSGSFQVMLSNKLNWKIMLTYSLHFSASQYCVCVWDDINLKWFCFLIVERTCCTCEPRKQYFT